jgi:hypothetical protein
MSTRNVTLSRIELNWLYRQMMSGKDRAEGALKLQTDSGKADADKVFELM